MIHKQIQNLTQKEMTRKEFLATLGLGTAAVLGLGNILNLLHGNSPFMQSSHKSRGYGSSPYGK